MFGGPYGEEFGLGCGKCTDESEDEEERVQQYGDHFGKWTSDMKEQNKWQRRQEGV